MNFLGPYTLTRRLAPALAAAAHEDGDARIVNVASVMHRSGKPLLVLNQPNNACVLHVSGLRLIKQFCVQIDQVSHAARQHGARPCIVAGACLFVPVQASSLLVHHNCVFVLKTRAVHSVC